MSAKDQSKSISVIIVEKSALFREAMKQLLHNKDQFQVIAEGITLEDAVHLIQDNQKKADILLLDHQSIKAEKIEEFAKALQKNPDLKVVILSEQNKENYMIEALKLGASGYLLKEMDTDPFIRAIEDVYKGIYWFHPHVTDQFIKEYYTFLHHFANEKSEEIHIEAPKSVEIFTNREFEVLQLLSKGYSNRMIAETLEITSYTVSSHIRNILKKAGANDRTHAVVKAIANGWVQVTN